RVPLAHVDSSVAGGKSGRHGQAVSEDPDGASLAGMCEVVQDDDIVCRLLGRQHLWITRSASDPQTPLGVKVHGDRVDDVGLPGDELNLEAERQFHLSALGLDVVDGRGLSPFPLDRGARLLNWSSPWRRARSFARWFGKQS